MTVEMTIMTVHVIRIPALCESKWGANMANKDAVALLILFMRHTWTSAVVALL